MSILFLGLRDQKDFDSKDEISAFSDEKLIKKLLSDDKSFRFFDSFLLLLDSNADVIFASDEISEILGLNQVNY